MSTAQGAQPVVHSIDEAHCFATWDRVLIQMWEAEARLEAAEELLKVAHRFVANGRDEPLNCLSIVGSQSPAPTDKVRTQLAACYRYLAPCVVQQIWVAEGSGFRAALVRGVGLTVSTLAPSFLPLKFAGSLDEAAPMIAPHLSVGSGGPEMLKSAVETIRRLIHQQGTH